jgi:hypothetical protein
MAFFREKLKRMKPPYPSELQYGAMMYEDIFWVEGESNPDLVPYFEHSREELTSLNITKPCLAAVDIGIKIYYVVTTPRGKTSISFDDHEEAENHLIEYLGEITPRTVFESLL